MQVVGHKLFDCSIVEGHPCIHGQRLAVSFQDDQTDI